MGNREWEMGFAVSISRTGDEWIRDWGDENPLIS